MKIKPYLKYRKSSCVVCEQHRDRLVTKRRRDKIVAEDKRAVHFTSCGSCLLSTCVTLLFVCPNDRSLSVKPPSKTIIIVLALNFNACVCRTRLLLERQAAVD
jgi:hypothetical protein